MRRSRGRLCVTRRRIFRYLPISKYLERYNILCRKLTQERLDTTATIVASPRTTHKPQNVRHKLRRSYAAEASR
jgi:hypothetical protein